MFILFPLNFFFQNFSQKVGRQHLYLEHTGRFLALEVANQLDDLIHVVETFQLTLVVNNLHWVLNHLRSDSSNQSVLFSFSKVNIRKNCLHKNFSLDGMRSKQLWE